MTRISFSKSLVSALSLATLLIISSALWQLGVAGHEQSSAIKHTPLTATAERSANDSTPTQPYDLSLIEADPNYYQRVDALRLYQMAPIPAGQKRHEEIRIVGEAYRLAVPQSWLEQPLVVLAKPGRPVTFLALDSGTFPNDDTSITIKADGRGLASTSFLPDGRAITYSYDITVNSFFANKVEYGNGIESTWGYNVGTKLNQRNEALLPADHYQQSILLSHFVDGRTRWIKRADGTLLHSRTSSVDAGVFTSLIYHQGETTEVKSTPGKVLVSHRQQRVDGSWEDLTTYEADNRRPVTGESQPDGRTWSAVRDSSNDRILLKTYPDGSTESFTYNGFAQPTSHTHRSGAIELWEYDAKGNLLSHTQAAGAVGVEATETWNYNARGQVVKHTDFNGNVITYEYAPNGDLKSLTLPQSTGQPAGTITYAYDAAGRLTSVTDPAGRFVSYGYDAAGRLILTTYGDGSTGQMNYGSGEFSARLLSQKDRNGNQTHYGFDATGRVLTTQVQDTATGEILTTTANTWDAPTGRLMAVDRDGDRTEYTYDYKGRVLTTTVHPNPNKVLTTTNVYDQYHLLSTTDPYGRKTSYTHDALDRVLASTVELTPAGATITTRNEYDAQGRQTAYIDGNGIRYEYDYDERDRKTRERSAIGTAVQAVETYSYDGNNNQLSMTDKNGRVWTRTYTSRNAVRTNANPLNQKTTNSYYADGLRESETNPNGHTTTFIYDTCCGRLIGVIDADQNTVRYDYDSNGNRTKVTDQSGRVTAYVYDGLDRQTKMIVDTIPMASLTKSPILVGPRCSRLIPIAESCLKLSSTIRCRLHTLTMPAAGGRIGRMPTIEPRSGNMTRTTETPGWTTRMCRRGIIGTPAKATRWYRMI